MSCVNFAKVQLPSPSETNGLPRKIRRKKRKGEILSLGAAFVTLFKNDNTNVIRILLSISKVYINAYVIY